MRESEIFILAPQAQSLSAQFSELFIGVLNKFIWFADTFGPLLSVAIAVILYLWKVKIDKRNAARVLLMEIRNAERTLKVIKESGVIAETTFVMPVSSWKKFQHYFVKDFDIDELDDLNHFYNLCILIQKEVNRMKDQLPTSNEEKIKITQQKLLDLADKYAGNEAGYLQARKEILYDRFFSEVEWFIPDLPKTRTMQHLGNVKPVLTTTCGKKLKKIAAFK